MSTPTATKRYIVQGPQTSGDIQTTTIVFGFDHITYSQVGKLYFNFYFTDHITGEKFPFGGQTLSQATITATKLALIVGGTLNTQYSTLMGIGAGTSVVTLWNGGGFQIVNENAGNWALTQGILIN